jgi:hypothetical protein
VWAKGLNAKDIHKEMFPVHGGKCLSRKAVHNWVEILPLWWQRFADDEEVGKGGAEVAKIKRLLCRGFRRTGKAMGQVYHCCWRDMPRNKCFFQVGMSNVLRFISICDLFTDSPS